jgi:hypothetical protein
MSNHVLHAAPRRNTAHRAKCSDGLSLPTISEPVLDLARLTAGGAEIYRRVRRSVPLCNRLAEIAGIGQMEAR